MESMNVLHTLGIGFVSYCGFFAVLATWVFLDATLRGIRPFPPAMATLVLGWGGRGLWWGLVLGLGVAAVLLSDGDDDAVVKDALQGQVHVHDLRHDQPDEREEEPFGRLAEKAVLHRRAPDDGGGIDRMLPAGHGGAVEDVDDLDETYNFRIGYSW